MRYVTSHERHGFEKGMQQGLQQGIEQGWEQGWEKGLQKGKVLAYLEKSRDAVLEVLRTRFIIIPDETVFALDGITQPAMLSDLLKQAVLTNSLQEFNDVLREKIAAVEQVS